MSKKDARVGDKVVAVTDCQGGCNSCPHPGWTGKITIGSENVLSEGRPTAMADGKQAGVIKCPHEGKFVIVAGSGDVEVNGNMCARLNDQVKCLKCGAQGIIAKGASKTYVNAA